jgi:hypothetical protein
MFDVRAKYVCLCSMLSAVAMGCPSPPYRQVLLGAYQDEDAARSVIGRAVVERGGASVEPFEAFRVAETPAVAFTGELEEKERIERAFTMRLAAVLKSNCRGTALATLGNRTVSDLVVTVEKEMTPLFEKWFRASNGGCCTNAGEPTPVCKGKHIIKAIYRTTATFTVDASVGVEVSGTVACHEARGATGPAATAPAATAPAATAPTATAPAAAADAAAPAATAGPAAPGPAGAAPAAAPPPAETPGASVQFQVLAKKDTSTRLRSTGWNLVLLENVKDVCEMFPALPSTPPPRAMKPPEIELARTFARELSRGLLETYPCQWMYVGAAILNTACEGSPCEPSAVLPIYERTIKDVLDDARLRSAVCDGIKQGMGALGANDLALDCSASTPFLQRLRDARFSSFVRDAGLQIGVIRDVVYRLPGSQRVEAIERMLVEWPRSARDRQPFDDAERAWRSLSRSCEPVGCVLPWDGATTWRTEVARRSVFERWLEHFAGREVTGFRPGCPGSAVRYHGGRWHYEGTACRVDEYFSVGKCMTFGGHDGAGAAAGGFITWLLGSEPSPN